MSIPRRLGRLARGFVSTLGEDERVQERLRSSRERGEVLKGALGAAWRGASEEWRAAEARRVAEEAEERRDSPEERSSGERSGAGRSTNGWRSSATAFVPRRYPVEVLAAYGRLDLAPGTPLEEVHKKRRDLVKKFHPDRFADPEKRAKAERVTAEINSAHDTVARHKTRSA